MKKIVIVGSGFSGLATAVQLIHQLEQSACLTLVNPDSTFATGLAYQPHANKLLLNVHTAQMSLFPDSPEHFLNWVKAREQYRELPRHFVAQAFLPRALYGQYLQEVWQQSLALAQAKIISVQQLTAEVTDCVKQQQQFQLSLDNGQPLSADILVLANGNHLPGNKVLPDRAFASSPNYVQNPWQPSALSALNPTKPVLILGNGLTMVDTVISLRQHGFTQPIVALSRHGYAILPHRHNGLDYPDFSAELLAAQSLRELVGIVARHLRLVRHLGISAEPVINAIRPYTSVLWRKLSVADKAKFLSRVRHLWGVARHRLPLQVYEQIQQLQLNGSLKVYAGKLKFLEQKADEIFVQFQQRGSQQVSNLLVGGVINCTGPETDLGYLPNHFLSKMLSAGILQQDVFKLGIVTDVKTFNPLDAEGRVQPNLFTLGSNLRGELWESTAVQELRSQAQQLAAQIICRLNSNLF